MNAKLLITMHHKTIKKTAESMGISSSILFRLLNELYSIEIEEQHKEKKESDFREKLVCCPPKDGPKTIVSSAEKTSKNQGDAYII